MSSQAITRIPESILVTRHDKIGDFILALPLCKAIKNYAPDIRLGILVSEVNYEFASSLDFIDQVILLGSDFWSTVNAIRNFKPEVSISCFIDNRLGLLLWTAGVRKRIAPATKIAQVFFNSKITQRRSHVAKPEWQYNMELGATLFPADALFFSPPLITTYNTDPKVNRVVFHPGYGGSSAGNLRLEDYLRLARRASKIPNLEVVFTFGPNDRALLDRVRSILDFQATIVSEPMTLLDFCRFISQSRLFVSTSTGPMHLAGSVNTPTLSFFGSSLFASSKRWAPISDPSLQTNLMIGDSYEPCMVDLIESLILDIIGNNGNGEI